MLKQITAGIGLASFLALPAMAAPERMTSAQLDEVVAGGATDCCCYPGTEKGNNGWGNGADPSNPGSDHGLTAPSKVANTNLPSPPNGPNTNPTGSTGR